MTIFDGLTLIGGLCLFLFGMNVMGQGLERRAGNSLKLLLSRLTGNKLFGFLTGLVVTSIIQSSSATTVMVVGFVNSGLMTLSQSIPVIIGANVGTTVTGWILSMEQISGESLILEFLKPSSFTPVLAVIGIVFYMFCKSTKKKDTGTILLGFAVLMFGMETMSGSIGGLKGSAAFQQLFIAFENPILGMLVGAILTAIIQSSSASVGILQSLAAGTGLVTIGTAIPIVMGQAIGTCVTAVISCFGANRNEKSAAMAHLTFNVLGTVVWLTTFIIVDATVSPAIFGEAASMVSIATINTIFKVLCTLLFLPISCVLEKVALRLIPEKANAYKITELDERLLATPTIAIERCRSLTCDMADAAASTFESGITMLKDYDPKDEEGIRKLEGVTDHYEDILGTYLVKLSTQRVSDADSAEIAGLLKVIGDFERIADHGLNLMGSGKEIKEKGIKLSENALRELDVIISATGEVLSLAVKSFKNLDLDAASNVEPLEQVIDVLKEKLRAKHISRLQKGECSIEAGFVLSDMLTDLERISDHCSNIAGCMIDMADGNLNIHESLRAARHGGEGFESKFKTLSEKYSL